jgi:hypothetical protein
MMSRYSNSNDIMREYATTLGPDFGRVYHALEGEVIWLHDKWREYCELFGTSPEIIDLLNEAASRFFGSVHDALWLDVLVHISRLTDAPKSAGNPTLTIRRLPLLIPDDRLRDEVKGLVATALAKSEFARDWRHRHIAHRALPLALEEAGDALANASRLSVKESIEAIDAVMKHIHQHYFDVELSYEVAGGPGDALDLLKVLRLGVGAARDRDRQ